MRPHYETMWIFKTKRFTIKWSIAPDDDCDLSFDGTGEVCAKLRAGEWFCFLSRVTVELDGRVIGEDYLGGSIYANPADFRDHIGMNARGHGSYFSDMVREAVREARKSLSGVPRMRKAA